MVVWLYGCMVAQYLHLNARLNSEVLFMRQRNLPSTCIPTYVCSFIFSIAVKNVIRAVIFTRLHILHSLCNKI
jgi:hypothetical protein